MNHRIGYPAAAAYLPLDLPGPTSSNFAHLPYRNGAIDGFPFVGREADAVPVRLPRIESSDE